ncbi:xanthine dehydrogenase family protein subunit M [Streptomyces sp. NPDC023723]|uniref:FAD binding domain-containing protein n=1 Tax=Streptomyces sp. NPDC023723 TaxID=3154323 RepID=UPI00340DA056
MQVPAPFEYARVGSVEEAITLLDRFGDTARLVAGGHSLLPMMKLRLASFDHLIDINDLHGELGYVRVRPGEVRIGALTRHRELLESDELAAVLPVFRDAERVIADPVVRNRGTLGGSLCQADPAEDLSAVCAALDATCVIRGRGGQRLVPMADFHRGPYETAVGDAELLTEVRLPVRAGSSSAYEKVERRAGDWAVVAAGAAVRLADDGRIADARVALAAVGPHAGAVPGVAEALRHRLPDEAAYARAGELAAQNCSPTGDHRGSAAYKRHLAGELTRRTLRAAVTRITGAEV